MANLAEHTIIRPVRTSLGVGAGAPPVETDDGLLLLFHERDGHERYSDQAALLDPETGRLRSQLAEPIMQPELDWERDGDVNNVIFVQGAIPRPDGSIYMTYGAADRNVGAAYVRRGRAAPRAPRSRVGLTHRLESADQRQRRLGSLVLVPAVALEPVAAAARGRVVERDPGVVDAEEPVRRELGTARRSGAHRWRGRPARRRRPSPRPRSAADRTPVENRRSPHPPLGAKLKWPSVRSIPTSHSSSAGLRRGAPAERRRPQQAIRASASRALS